MTMAIGAAQKLNQKWGRMTHSSTHCSLLGVPFKYVKDRYRFKIRMMKSTVKESEKHATTSVMDAAESSGIQRAVEAATHLIPSVSEFHSAGVYAKPHHKTLSSGLCLWFWPNRESRNWPQHRESPSTILGRAILYDHKSSVQAKSINYIHSL